MSRNDVIQVLKWYDAPLRENGATGLYMFGSRARGDARADSDLDLFNARVPSLFRLMQIEDEISAALGISVTITTRNWLARHPRVTFHYTPTRASWLNQVEGWFSILQGQSLTGATFTSVEQLKAHIDAFIQQYNDDAEPFVWTKSKVYQRRVKGRRLSEL